jgi:voltage-gated sodium channel
MASKQPDAMSYASGGMKGSKGAAAGPEMHSRKEHGGYRSTTAAAHGFKQLDQLGGANANSQGGTIDKETGKVDTSLAPKAIDKPPVPGGTAQHGEGAARREVQVPMVDKLPFNITCTLVAIANIIVIGAEEDAGIPRDAPLAARMSFWTMEVLFVTAFIGELVVRFVSKRREFLYDFWNVLDCLLVGAAAFEAFFLAPAGMGGQIRFFTVLRALRIVRVIRLVRMFAAFRELWLLVGGVVNSLKALGWVGIIMAIVLYVCAIVTTAEIGHNHETYATGPSYDGEVWPYEKYFGTVLRSMFTLFQVMTLDGWCDDVVRHVVYRQPLLGVFFIVFLVVTAFGLVNVVVGIIVENTLAAAQVADQRVEERKSFIRRDAVEKLHDILDKSDIRRTGEISFDELRCSYESHIVREKFDQIGLTLEEIGEIFTLLDHDQCGRVELTRFAASCRELVGGAKRRDLAQIEVTVGSLAQHLGTFEGQITRIENEVESLANLAEDFMQNTVRVLTGFDGSQKPPTRSTEGGFGHH